MNSLVVGTDKIRGRLVLLDLDGVLHHTLIVGQSGSGKSYFLVRLLEELLLRTSARIIAFDPNGDLRDFDKYDLTTFQTTRENVAERCRESNIAEFDTEPRFGSAWEDRRLVFLDPEIDTSPRVASFRERRRLSVAWSSLGQVENEALLALESRAPALAIGHRACASLLEREEVEVTVKALADAAKRFANSGVPTNEHPGASNLRPTDWWELHEIYEALRRNYRTWPVSVPMAQKDGSRLTLSDLVERGLTTSEWSALLLQLEASTPRDKLLAASAALEQAWESARSRKRSAQTSDARVLPTFIVVDEAHNFAPAITDDPQRRRVTERLIQIASEGRKYGLYLILATQRPTKLHPDLVSECENFCVLRVQAERELTFASEVMGAPRDRVGNAPRFEQGQGLLIGRWVGGQPTELLTAPARTLVGGGGADGIWKSPPEPTKLPGIGEESSEDNDGSAAAFADLVREISDYLEKESEPVALVRLADLVRSKADAGVVVPGDWAGYGSFKRFLDALEVPKLRVASFGPSYAYLEGVQQPPVAPEKPGLKDAPQLLHTLHESMAFPLLTSPEFAATFRAISSEVKIAPYSMAATSSSVRDRLRSNGWEISRKTVNFVLRGIAFGGHDYSSDNPQDSTTLGVAFCAGLVNHPPYQAADIAEQQRLVEWVIGLLYGDDEQAPSHRPPPESD